LEVPVHRNSNVIGPAVVKYRYQRGWTQDQLVAKLQILGCNMTRNILANIETCRSVATDIQIAFLVEVLGIEVKDLFPPRRPHPSGRVVGVTTEPFTRHQHVKPRTEEGVPSTAHS
jgi:transcriptional regulator with XRE-family HTH domain